jgi:hypothetical protein
LHSKFFYNRFARGGDWGDGLGDRDGYSGIVLVSGYKKSLRICFSRRRLTKEGIAQTRD